MIEGIEDVKTFLRQTQEIVVWEVNGFEQIWDVDAHNQYKFMLKTEFSDWLVKPGELGWKTPLNEIWQREGLKEGEGRIIITYNNGGQTEPEYFFPEVLEAWGNKDDPKDLKEYLDLEVREFSDKIMH